MGRDLLVANCADRQRTNGLDRAVRTVVSIALMVAALLSFGYFVLRSGPLTH